MEKYYEQKQIFILINQLCMIIFLCYEFLQSNIVGTAKLLPLTLITIMLIYGAYISFVNVKENNTLSQFSNLLLFTSWQFLLTLNGSEIFYTLSMLLSVVLLYMTVQFLLLFFFQDSNFTYKKETDWILQVTCTLTLIANFINDKIFAILFSCQWIFSFSCIIFLFLKHRKRIKFVFKSEKKHLLRSVTILIFPFSIYAMVFAESPEYLSNLGWYIVILLPLFSITAIAFKNHISMRQYFLLKEDKMGLIFLCFLVFISSLGVLFRFNMITYFIIIHTIFWFIQLYFILLFQETKNTILNSDTEELKTLPESSYVHNLVQIAKEEKLKSGFSDYLHDEILQDILAVKNMMNKSNKEEIHEMIVETLRNLNQSIRVQMQEYHPTLLKTLTLKENYRNLLEMLQHKYGMKNINISFKCNENLFLVEPYHLVIYRILKELVTNAFKHSECSKLVLSLTQENSEIELIVKDNGKGLMATETGALNGHRGLNSIKEQLFLLNGKMTISECNPTGLCVAILIPMRGDDSYQYFINR
ncbi:two-component system secretion system sensor histidine kinase SalK [Bacillus pakistanensis]|uniref:histidine kinase n=1 Tax=Rossellomorea pakistanensis TaxID=992288 RepID=A0ABS2NCX1_9BACI|nr:ATP-binding protein [Bacillus pakistanensis]MBM7585690.1 two-component system secretion system sensor histidine kinase SalK [Bacillus pakistanensis]